MYVYKVFISQSNNAFYQAVVANFKAFNPKNAEISFYFRAFSNRAETSFQLAMSKMAFT